MKNSSKNKKSELEIVREYAEKIIQNKIRRGHTDKKFKELFSGATPPKELWMDSSFYFSVVFQSTKQKTQFLEALKKRFPLDVDTEYECTIINGVALAKSMGIALVEEKMPEAPVGNLELRSLVLDNENP